MIGAVGTITRKDLRERLRDKSFFVLGILTPLVLAFIFDLVFGDIGEGELEVRIGVADVDSSEISGPIQERVLALDGQGGMEVSALGADADPGEAALGDDLDAVIVIPDGFGSDVTAGTGAPTLRVVEDPDRPVQAGIVGSIAEGLAADIDQIRLLRAAGAERSVPVESPEPMSYIEPDRERPGGAGLDAGDRMVAGMAVMFVFFTVQFGVTTLLNEKENGTLRRLLAAPIPRDSILLAKASVSGLLGLLATMILMVAGTVLMGASWGPWLGVVVLVIGAVLTAVALMAVVAGVAKTAEGASAAQAIIAVALAMLGGSWFPVSGEGFIGTLAHATPHYWFLSGLEDLAGAPSWTVVGGPFAALAAIAVVAGVPAALLLRRRLVP